MSTIAICLYSKYSQRCKEFMDEMGEDLDVQMVSVDNRIVREKILRDDQGYHVKTVPCIFLLYENGRLEKYEGSDAFVWLRKVKEALNQQSPPEESNLPPEEEEEEEKEAPPVPVEPSSVPPPPFPTERGTDQIITKKQENIKELAQAMQRQRESEEDNNVPPLQPALPIQRP